ncbi:hypothetical protein Micbo1qcDRAFT_205019 [Microdochium bolleyi]|uniref:ADP-ribosylation factor family-domain-containing protein n=1 Tax=Microdochium bolleyi TaxID=196109 RepID=A0A136J1M6_9PEZI|nr:hypothetical protein Micbo1qcDRAFT_205019 [Microdochium bolleyi]
MDVISRMNLLRWLPQRSRSRRHVKVCLFGADTSGKTSLLYRLKLGHAVATIPTIGFNIETVEHVCKDNGEVGPEGGGAAAAAGQWEFEIWDVGGCDRMIGLMHHYIHPDSVVLFLHDCAEPEPDRLENSVRLLHAHVAQMLEKEARYLWVVLSKQDLLPEGEERISKVEDLRRRFESELGGGEGERGRYEDKSISWRVIGEEGLSAVTGAGLDAVLDDVCRTLSAEASNQDGPEKKHKATDSASTSAAHGLQQLQLSDEDMKTQAEKEISAMQPPDVFWGEFLDGTLTAWDHASHLYAGYLVLLDCLAGGGGVFESADVFLRHLARLRSAQPERFRNTAHVTMTIFWLLQLHIAAVRYQAASSQAMFPSGNQFRDVVVHSPLLMNRSLWGTYYSKDLLFSPAAREEWHLPDLAPLPSINIRQSRTKGDSLDFLAGRQPTSAAAVKVDSNTSDRLIEYAFEVIRKCIIRNLRRGALVEQALNCLQRTTMELRATDSSVPAYSETQAYFWVQIVHAALKSLEHRHDGDGSDNTNSSVSPSGQASFHTNSDGAGTLSNLAFATFKTLYGLDGDKTWRLYYTPRTWEQVSARMQFVPPDIKALPNIISAEDEAVAEARSQAIQTATEQAVMGEERLPGREVLAFLADCVTREAAEYSQTAAMAMGAEHVTTGRVQTHAELLWHLYSKLSAVNPSANKNHNDAGETPLLFTSSSQAATILEGFVLRKHNSLTEKSFWLRQLMAAATSSTTPPPSFERLIRAQPQLAFERLPFVYYSPELWRSAEARSGFVPPDRRALPPGL